MNRALSRPLLALSFAAAAAALVASPSHAQPARPGAPTGPAPRPTAGTAAGASHAPAQDLDTELLDASHTFRASYKSSNRWGLWNGWRYGWGATVDTANDKQAAEIDRLKALAITMGRGTDNHHRSILSYAEVLESTVVDGSHVGNCGDINVALYAHIFHRFAGLEVTLVGRSEGDHQFVLVRDKNSDIHIADGWSAGGRIAGPLRLNADGVLVLKGTTTPVGPPWEGPVVSLGGDGTGDWVKTQGTTLTTLSSVPYVPVASDAVLERVVTKVSTTHTVAATNRASAAKTLRVGVFGPTRARLGGTTVTFEAGATKSVDLEGLLRGCRVGAPCDATRPRVGRYVTICSDLPYSSVRALAPSMGAAGVHFAFTPAAKVCDPAAP